MESNLNSLATSQNPRLQIGVAHAKALGKIDWFLRDYCKFAKRKMVSTTIQQQLKFHCLTKNFIEFLEYSCYRIGVTD